MIFRQLLTLGMAVLALPFCWASKIDGLVIVTSDNAILRSAGAILNREVDERDLGKAFPSPRFAFKTLDETVLLLVDLECGQLRAFQDRQAMGKALLEKLSPSGVLFLKDLSSSEQQAFANLSPLGRLDPKTSRLISPTVVGLFVGTNVTVHMDTGDKSVQVPLNAQSVFGAVQAEKRSLSQSPSSSSSFPQYLPDKKALGPLEFHWLGKLNREFPNKIGQMSIFVEQICAEARFRDQQLASQLLKKIGLKGPQLGEQSVSPDEVPRSLMDQISAQFAGDWRSMGFASEEEARNAFGSAGKFSFKLEIGFYECFEVGDSEFRTPSKGAVGIFMSTPGVIVP